MNYTEKTLAQVLETNLNNVTVSELDTNKVYIFKIKNSEDYQKDVLCNFAYDIKNKLEELGIKFIIVVDNSIEVAELERSDNND